MDSPLWREEAAITAGRIGNWASHLREQLLREEVITALLESCIRLDAPETERQLFNSLWAVGALCCSLTKPGGEELLHVAIPPLLKLLDKKKSARVERAILFAVHQLFQHHIDALKRVQVAFAAYPALVSRILERCAPDVPNVCSMALHVLWAYCMGYVSNKKKLLAYAPMLFVLHDVLEQLLRQEKVAEDSLSLVASTLAMLCVTYDPEIMEQVVSAQLADPLLKVVQTERYPLRTRWRAFEPLGRVSQHSSEIALTLSHSGIFQLMLPHAFKWDNSIADRVNIRSIMNLCLYTLRAQAAVGDSSQQQQLQNDPEFLANLRKTTEMEDQESHTLARMVVKEFFPTSPLKEQKEDKE